MLIDFSANPKLAYPNVNRLPVSMPMMYKCVRETIQYTAVRASFSPDTL